MGSRLWPVNTRPPSGAACFRGNGAAGSAAKLPGGPVGELRSFRDAGAAQKARQPHHRLSVCAESRLGKHKETFLKQSTGAPALATDDMTEVMIPNER